MIRKKLGILGGMGPYAGEFFFRLVTEHTKAERDADHIDAVMTSTASTPDRSAYISDPSKKNPFAAIEKDVKTLVFGGAEIIALPCNTACCFIDNIAAVSSVPVINMIKETVKCAKISGARKIGIFATEGTVAFGKYQSECRAVGIEPVVPDNDTQTVITESIYRKIKAGNRKVNEIYPEIDKYLSYCDAVVFGCTELSLIDVSQERYIDKIIDSTQVLAIRSIFECGARPINFDKIYERYVML